MVRKQAEAQQGGELPQDELDSATVSMFDIKLNEAQKEGVDGGDKHHARQVDAHASERGGKEIMGSSRAQGDGLVGRRVEIVCKQRGWVPGEIVAFDQASGTCKVLIEDFCLGSAQVDAQIPSSAIHICSADAPLIVEVNKTTTQHVERSGVFVRMARPTDAGAMAKLSEEFKLELAKLNEDDESPSLGIAAALSVLEEDPSALIVVIGAKDELNRETVFGYCYAFREESAEEKSRKLKRRGGANSFKSLQSLYIAEIFVEKNRRTCGFGEMLLIETIRHYSGLCSMPSSSECNMHAKIDPKSSSSHLYVSPKNAEAIRFYKKFGYIHTDLRSGDASSTLVMTLDLTSRRTAKDSVSGCVEVPKCLEEAASRLQRQTAGGNRPSKGRKSAAAASKSVSIAPSNGAKKAPAKPERGQTSHSSSSSDSSSPVQAKKSTSKRVTAPTAKKLKKQEVEEESDVEEEEEEEGESSSEGELEICDGCGCDKDPVSKKNLFLMCDKCDGQYHLSCAGLDTVPDDDWFCAECAPVPRSASTIKAPSKCAGNGVSANSAQGLTATRSEASDSDDNETPCVKCNLTRDPRLMIVCDGCEQPHHIFCVGLKRIPVGDFFCDKCSCTTDETPRKESILLQPSALPNACAFPADMEMAIMPEGPAKLTKDGLDLDSMIRYYTFRKEAAFRFGGIYGTLLFEGCVLSNDEDVCRGEGLMVPRGLLAVRNGERIIIDTGSGLHHGTVRREPVVLEARDGPGALPKQKLLQYELDRSSFSVTGPKTAAEVLKELSLRVHLDVAKNHVMSDLLVRAIRFDKADDSMLDSAPPSPMNTAQAAEDKWWHGLESLVTENQSECFILPGAKFPNRMPATGEIRLLDICHFATSDMTEYQMAGAAEDAMRSGYYAFDRFVQTAPGRYRAMWKPITS